MGKRETPVRTIQIQCDCVCNINRISWRLATFFLNCRLMDRRINASKRNVPIGHLPVLARILPFSQVAAASQGKVFRVVPIDPAQLSFAECAGGIRQPGQKGNQ